LCTAVFSADAVLLKQDGPFFFLNEAIKGFRIQYDFPMAFITEMKQQQNK
jgi:hypothetical protein